jgi:hypothetical protein
MATAAVAQYLEHYAEPIADWFKAEFLPQLQRTYQFVLVIPAFAEPLDCLENVLPADLQQTLVIVIVNSGVDSDPGAIVQTQAFLRQFHDTQAVVYRLPLSKESDCLIVDCTSEGRQLPPKQGVGLARKIGGDIALVCIQKGIVKCPWIHCTDADVKLPLNYFDLEPPLSEVAVAIYPFEHHPLHENILSYEISLRYHVLQLARSGSPYAFQTIGSLLKINPLHYAMVRGFPKLKAAEDFYMLNKLAKVGQVVRLKEPVIRLSSRISQRVPFGTGAAMTRFAKQPCFDLYHPQIFQHLQTWLAIIPTLWRDRDAIQRVGIDNGWSYSPLILDALSVLGLRNILPHAYQQCSNSDYFQRYLWIWFDAFRTLKFIHHLRDNGFPNLLIVEAIESLAGIPQLIQHNGVSFSSLQQINSKLVALEDALPKLIFPIITLSR